MDDKKMAEQVTDATRGVLESMMKLEEINDRTVHNLAQKQFIAAGDYMNSAVKHLRQMSEAKEPTLPNHAELAAELSAKMLFHANETLAVLNASKAEMNAVVEKGLASFFEMASQLKVK